jgi:WASH complex subunit strumpellin
VLEVIPRNMFRLLSDIIQLMTFQLRPLPMKVERLQLKEYSQPDLRQSLARLTHQV